MSILTLLSSAGLPRNGLLAWLRPSSVANVWDDTQTWDDSHTWSDTTTGWVDYIGLSVSDYARVDSSVADIFFSNSTTLRSAYDAAVLALSSSELNRPGGTLYGTATQILLYADGMQPVESVERRLWRILSGARFDAMFDNGESMTDNGNQMFEVNNA